MDVISEITQAVGGQPPQYARPSPPSVCASRRRADRSCRRHSSSTFPRSPLQLPYALTPGWVKRPG